MKLAAEGFEARHIEKLARLFHEASSACFCRYWHFDGNKNAWLERLAFRPEQNEKELRDAAADEHPSARGLVAIDEADPETPIVGWMKLAPAETLPKLTKLPVYRDLAPRPIGTWSVGCFLVSPRARKRGVSRALVLGIDRIAPAWGALAVEAYPRRSTEPLHDEEAWQGYESVFREAGFVVHHDVAPYPVYRKTLTHPASARP